MTQAITIKDTRNNLADIINQVAIGGNTFIVTKFGKPKAMIVPVVKNTMEKTALEESFGMWADRKDIKNTAQWVRKLRQKMSTRHGKLFS